MSEKRDSQMLDQALKSKLQIFLQEMVKFGCVKGFRYFAMYLRGREEMLLSVINETADADNYSLCSVPNSPASINSGGHFSLGASFNSGNLPYDKNALLMSGQSEKNVNNTGDSGVFLAPASPSERETTFAWDPNTTVFLMAGYSKYASPHVWVRSNHERLIKYAGQKDKDNPLSLKSVRKFHDTDVKVWDVIAELVKLCTYPAPQNPFSVDFGYFETLKPAEKLLATSSMVNALQTIVTSRAEDKHYTAKLLDDLQHMTRLHFEMLQALSVSEQLPCLEEYLTRAAAEQAQQQARRRHSSGVYPPGYSTYLNRYH